MGEGAKSGLPSAVDRAMAQHEPEPAPVQLPLMPADRLDQVEQGDGRKRALQAPRRGRPPGAVNRKTAAMAEWLLSRYPSPLQVLAEIYSRDVGDLAAEANCTRLEALRLQKEAAAELAPYLHGKMPVEVNLGGALPVLHLVPPEAAAAAFKMGEDGKPVFDLSLLQPIEQNQSLIEGSATEVAQPQSDSEPKASPDQSHSASDPLIEDQQG